MRLHLLDIRRRRSHTTVEGVELDIEQTNISHEWRLDCRRVLSALARRRLKVITFASVEFLVKFMRARFRARMASRHCSLHCGTGTCRGLVDDLGIDCSEALIMGT